MDWTSIKIALSVCAGVCFILIIVWLKRDRSVERRLHTEVIRLRQARRGTGQSGSADGSREFAAEAAPERNVPPATEPQPPG